MAKISRRSALGSVAATAFVGLTAKAASALPQTVSGKPNGPVKSMTLAEFQKMNSPVATKDLFSHIEGHTFMMCHEEMRKKHGIWIPELVPVFEKMDAMRATTV